MNKKILGGLAAVVAVVIAVVVSMGGGGSNTIKIAYQGPLSGGEAQTGTDEQNAVKFAIELYNATNPAQKIELVSADDQGDGTVAASVAPGIANDKSIVAVVGPAYSKVFIIDDQSAYSVGLVEYLTPSLPASVVVGSDSTKNDTSDFAATVAKVKSKGANVVIYTGYYSQAAILVKQLRDGGYKGIFAGGDGVLNSEFAVLAGAAAEGARLTGATVPLGELSPDLAAKFKESLGVEPGVYAAESFDAANIIIDAIKAGNTTRETILAYIKTVQFVGIGGEVIAFDANGDSTLGFINGFEVKAGKVVSTGAVK